MKYCIPDELFNNVKLPIDDLTDIGIDDIYKEMAYKLPNAPEVTVKHELWHTICDFCFRTGALLEKSEKAAGTASTYVEISPVHGTFLRVVACMYGDGDTLTNDITVPESLQNSHRYVEFPTAASTLKKVVWVSVRPLFSGTIDTSVTPNNWNPKIPKYIITKYGECIMHGALMRIYAMTGRPWSNVDLARMHGVAYNNDLNRLSFGMITSGMRKHLLIDIEDFIVSNGQPNRVQTKVQPQQ